MWLLISLTFAILEWAGEARKKRWVIYISKPMVIISLLIWIFTNIPMSQIFTSIGRFRLVWFVVGLLCCLIGDIFLMLPSKFFIPGLTAFLFCHVFYAIGFGLVFPRRNIVIPGLIVIFLIGMVSFYVFIKLAQGLSLKKLDNMRIPILFYSIIISIMLYTAVITLLTGDWNFQNAFLVSIGALAFYISDILNAWLRFVENITSGRLKIMMTYHLGQTLLVIGIVFHLNQHLNGSL